MKKYLPLYYGWMQRGYFPFLCNYFGETHEDFNLFVPDADEKKQHEEDGYGWYAWGVLNSEPSGCPSPLRQNILLLMAAMNNEL